MLLAEVFAATRRVLAGVILCICMTGGQAAGQADTKPCMPCEDLVKLRIPEVRIDSAIAVQGSGAKRSGRPHCRVVGVIGKEIGFELLLPNDWNKRFVMGGGGGFVGYIMNRAANMVHDGYATSGTDTGHRGTDARWGLNNMERQLNFGHMAVHRTAQVSKAIVYHYYGTDPTYSYFIGLSRGGGQAMMEAQRYPDDFDGIVAGAPAFNWTGMAAEFAHNMKAVYPDPSKNTPVLTADNLRLLGKMTLARCDGKDGVRDSILNDPRECDFDLRTLPRCKGDIAGPNCITTTQLEALKVVYKGVTGLHTGFSFGGENERTGWFPSIVGPIKGSAPYHTWQEFYGMETLRNLVFNDPEWSYSQYDFSKFHDDTRYASSYLDATSTDYSAFIKRGGKMIIYQGWIDPLISALDIINHYERAHEANPDLTGNIRLYMLPGVTHTGGNGPGKTDWFDLIQRWVEKGEAPERVVMSRVENGKVTLSRPVFPYPRKAVYDGKGDPSNEKSFR